MQLILKTEPQFLERHFSYLEKSLLGQWRQRVDPTRSDYWIRFSLQPQPVISLEKRASKQAESYSQTKLAQTNLAPQTASTPETQVFPGENIFSGLNSDFWTGVANWAMGFLMLAATVVLIVVYGPQLYYSVFGSEAEKLAANSVLNQQAESGKNTTLLAEITPAAEENLEQEDKSQVEGVQRYLPEKDSSLPQGDWIIIPRIGVYTQLQRTPESQEALETGVWWVPDFALPGELDRPMIVAGHRYGWQWWWKTDYWKYHSFYKLPELEVGDQIEIISDQRKWVYEIYASEEDQEITDYEADLILYTCKFLNSPIRFFKYANLENK